MFVALDKSAGGFAEFRGADTTILENLTWLTIGWMNLVQDVEHPR